MNHPLSTFSNANNPYLKYDNYQRQNFHQNVTSQINMHRPYDSENQNPFVQQNTQASSASLSPPKTLNTYGYQNKNNIINNTRYDDHSNYTPVPKRTESPFREKEDVPTFSYENDRNWSHFKGYIQSKQSLINQYQNSYIEYMKNQWVSDLHSRRTPLRVMQSVPDIAVSNQNLYETNYDSLGSRLNDVTNPDMYYKRQNREYGKYIEQQRSYLIDNYALMEKNRNKKKEINVNPFNPNSNDNILGRSTLVHNTILEPLPNFSYNKYIAGRLGEGSGWSNNNNNNKWSSAGSNFITGK